MGKTSLTYSVAFIGLVVASVVSCANSAHSGLGPDGGPLLGGSSTPGLLGNDDGGVTGNLTNDGLLACAQTSRPCTTCTDFAASAVIDASPDDGLATTPADAPSHFHSPGFMTGGPCLAEPADGALIPQNWLRPRFRYVPAAGQNLFEIRLHADRQTNDLLVYTTSKTWKLPKDTWDKLRSSTWDEDITVTVRGVNRDDPASTPTGTSGKFRIAPAAASGAMIYWAAVGEYSGMSWLEGFNPGDETVAKVLDVSQVQLQISRDQGGQLQTMGRAPGAVQCIGCHVAVPDGNSVAFTDFWPWSGVVASVQPGHTGEVPSWLTGGGAQAFSQPWLGITTFSKTVWSRNEFVAISSYGCSPQSSATNGNQPWYPWNGQTCSMQPNGALAWFDLASGISAVSGTSGYQVGNGVASDVDKSFGFLRRNGDPRGAEAPSWSHNGSTIVYVSTNAGQDGRLATGPADLYTVPYNARAGGDATPVQGASEANWSEYYPAYAPNDQLIAFNRAPSSEDMYYNPHSEVFAVPAGGAAQPTRLAANDPPACLGVVSPGVTNSWAKWSPDVEKCANGLTYYWIILSSSRDGNQFKPSNLKTGGKVATSQLYIAGLTVDANGQIASFPALYIWNQPMQYVGTNAAFAGAPQSNHTPVWEVVSIPKPPPPPPPK